MAQDYLCISIPEELQKFTKEAELVEPVSNNINTKKFGVEPITDTLGNTVGAAYYSDTGELIKKVLYNGSSVKSIENYRNGKLYSQEEFSTGKIVRKVIYNTLGNKISILKYKYDRDNQIICIQKFIDDVVYSIHYGYDDLNRVNSRIIYQESKVINEQKFTYDILDRIVEYRDSNQYIRIKKVNPNNDLVSYIITDVIGNQIIINNKFICSEYIGTEIELNGHKTSVKDQTYISNTMLKRPYTNEDDLNFALSHFINIPKLTSSNFITTKRQNDINTDKLSNLIISNKKESDSKPPISADNIHMLKLK